VSEGDAGDMVEVSWPVLQDLALPLARSIQTMDGGGNHLCVTSSCGKVMSCAVTSKCFASEVIQLKPVPTLEEQAVMTPTHADSSRVLALENGVTVAQLYMVIDLKSKATMLNADNEIIAQIEAARKDCEEKRNNMKDEKMKALSMRDAKSAGLILGKMCEAEDERKHKEDALSKRLCSPILIRACADQIMTRNHLSNIERIKKTRHQNNQIIEMQKEAWKHRPKVTDPSCKVQSPDLSNALSSVLEEQKVAVQEMKDSVCHDLDVVVEGLMLSQQFDQVDRASRFLAGVKEELGIAESIDDPLTSWKPSVGLIGPSQNAKMPNISGVALPINQVTDDANANSVSSLPTERSRERSAQTAVASQVETLTTQMNNMASQMKRLLEELAVPSP
jgi:hypothetical protein